MNTDNPEYILYSLTMDNSRKLVYDRYKKVHSKNTPTCPNYSMIEKIGTDVFSQTTLCLGCGGQRKNICSSSSSIRDSVRNKKDLVKFYQLMLEMDVVENRNPFMTRARGLVAQMFLLK